MSQENVKALVLTRYESKGASSRIRLLQFLPTFETFMTVQVQSLFSDSYVDGIGRRSKTAQFFHGFPGLVKRVTFLGSLMLRRRKFDVVILQQEVFPFIPSPIEIWILRRLTAGILVLDIDDGNQIRYKQGNFLTRGLCGGKFEDLWSFSDLVVCGSQQLVDDVAPCLRGTARAAMIPSVPPESTARIERLPATPPPFLIGWIGSPSTAPDLEIVRKPLSALAKETDIELQVVGAEIEPSPDFKVRCIPWSNEAEEKLLRTMHVGIMPLADTDFRQRKCGYKLVQYMSVGIPVIASDVGGNRSIVMRGNDLAGYVAKSDAEWVSAFCELFTDENVRRDRGRAAARIASEEFSFASACAKWKLCLQGLLGSAKDKAV